MRSSLGSEIDSPDMYFPTLCVDHFFNDPDKVRNYALSLDYFPPESSAWPGKRSKRLDQVDTNYHQQFCEKLFSLFYDFKHHRVNWQVETYFQIIDAGETVDISSGWVHSDDCLYAGVIYLSPDIDLNCGTSIYRSKQFDTPIHQDFKNQQFLNFKKEDKLLYDKKRSENNDLFEKTIEFKNVYNRLIAYDGFNYHAVDKLQDSSKERLTQVFFIDKVESDYFPIPHSKQRL
jgi:hypothetical protein